MTRACIDARHERRREATVVTKPSRRETPARRRARPAVISVHQLVISGRESRESKWRRSRARSAHRRRASYGSGVRRDVDVSTPVRLEVAHSGALPAGDAQQRHAAILPGVLPGAQARARSDAGAGELRGQRRALWRSSRCSAGSSSTGSVRAPPSPSAPPSSSRASRPSRAPSPDGSPKSRLRGALRGYVYGTGCSTSLTAALGANYATFKDKNVHGRLVGLLLSFFGLSSGIFFLVYDVFFDEPVAFVRCPSPSSPEAPTSPSFLVGHPKHIALPGDAIADVAARAFTNQAPSGSSLGAGRRLRDASARFFGPAGCRDETRARLLYVRRRRRPRRRSPPLSPNSRTAHLSWLSRASP